MNESEQNKTVNTPWVSSYRPVEDETNNGSKSSVSENKKSLIENEMRKNHDKFARKQLVNALIGLIPTAFLLYALYMLKTSGMIDVMKPVSGIQNPVRDNPK